jgi:hypothetical protein
LAKGVKKSLVGYKNKKNIFNIKPYFFYYQNKVVENKLNVQIISNAKTFRSQLDSRLNYGITFLYSGVHGIVYEVPHRY